VIIIPQNTCNPVYLSSQYLQRVYTVTQGCDSRINAKAIRMRKVVKCERFARIGILELHFRLRTPKSANGTLRVVHPR
jgi:hypothetical protein